MRFFVCFLNRQKPSVYPYRSSRPEMFCKKDVLRNFAKFTGKHPGLRPATSLKKEAMAHVFSCEFCEISKYTFSYITSPVAAFALKLL